MGPPAAYPQDLAQPQPGVGYVRDRGRSADTQDLSPEASNTRACARWIRLPGARDEANATRITQGMLPISSAPTTASRKSSNSAERASGHVQATASGLR